MSMISDRQPRTTGFNPGIRSRFRPIGSTYLLGKPNSLPVRLVDQSLAFAGGGPVVLGVLPGRTFRSRASGQAPPERKNVEGGWVDQKVRSMRVRGYHILPHSNRRSSLSARFGRSFCQHPPSGRRTAHIVLSPPAVRSSLLAEPSPICFIGIAPSTGHDRFDFVQNFSKSSPRQVGPLGKGRTSRARPTRIAGMAEGRGDGRTTSAGHSR